MKAQQKEVNSKHMQNYRANHDQNKDKETDKIKLSDRKIKVNLQVLKRDRIKEIFNSIQVGNTVDPSVLSTEAYKTMKEVYEAAIYEGPTCIKCL